MTDAERPKIIVFPPVIFVVVCGAGLLLHRLLPWGLAPSPLLRGIGIGVALAGLFIVFAAAGTFRRSGTTARPNQPAKALVARGPYAFSRNPMYLALCLLNLGVAFWVAGLFPLLMTGVLAAALHYGAILPEERHLEAKFGDAYREYTRTVRRWI